MLIKSWTPSVRNCVEIDRPEWVPVDVYHELLAARRSYNTEWEFWVQEVANQYNCSIPVAEDACIRGIKKAITRLKYVYGDRVGEWYEQALGMGDIFEKVKHQEYINPKLEFYPEGDVKDVN